MVLHPAFDTKTSTWFVDEYEAPTLRELKVLAGPNVEFQDYYPIGLARAIYIQRAKNESRRRSGFSFCPLKVKIVVDDVAKRRSRAECNALRIAATVLLEAGRTTGEIAAELHCTRNSVSGIRSRWLAFKARHGIVLL